MIGFIQYTLPQILQTTWQVLRDPAMNTLLVLISVILSLIALVRSSDQEKTPAKSKEFWKKEDLQKVDYSQLQKPRHKKPRKKPHKH